MKPEAEQDEVRRLLSDRLFDLAPVMMVALDAEFRIVEANAAFARLFGEWEGKRCFELMKGRESQCEQCQVSLAFADGKARLCDELLTVARDTISQFIVRVAPLGQPGGGSGPYLLWMASKVNEASILQRENDILFEGVPCYVTVLDRDLEVIRANRRMRETFGKAPGKKCYEVYKRRDRPCRKCPALLVFEDGQEHSAEQVGVTANGEATHYIVTASPLSREGGSPNGKVNFVIEIATDVTHLRTLEHEKIEAERMAAVGQTVAGLAHGIKNILMGVEGGIYVMESGMRKGQIDRVDRGIQMLKRNVEKISSLVKNLLSFSKGRPPHVTVVDPNAPAREVLDLYSGMARQAGVVLEGVLKEGLAPAALDAEGIHACLTNLVSNAVDACLASEKKDCKVVLTTSEADGALVYEVADNGCGMDYEVKKKIFTTFFTTKGAGGTGLGLLTSRKIVQEHGGKILVESDPGKGTRVRIVLPRDRLPVVTAVGAAVNEGQKEGVSRGETQ
jgi:signal transduction histidine kinase